MTQFSNELKQNLVPLYVEKFKLTHHPFSSQFNSALFYETEAREIITKKIAHLLDFTKLILFVQGEAGLGKTTLIRQRIRQTKDNWRTSLINSQDFTKPELFIAKIAADMGVKSHRSISLELLKEQLDAMRQTGLNPILFIDDVEQINASIIPTLAELIQHTPDKQPSLRLIISGQDLPSELSNVIPVESDESTLKYLPIPPLTEIETTEYIKHRLRASNYPYLEPFNKTQIKKIYLESKGFPGRINHLADQLFARYTAEYEDNKPLIHLNENANKLLKYIAAGLSVLVVIFVVFSLFDSEEPEADLATIEENVQTLGISTIKQTQHTPDNKFSPAGETVLKEISIPPEVKEKPEPLQKKTVNEKIKPGVVASSKTLSPKEVHVSAAEKKPAATKAHVIKKTKSKPLKATVKTIRSSHRWIRKQNPKHFTLQLISGANKAATVKFIKKHKLEKDAATLHSIYKGRDWYSVIYKAFSTKKAARQARNALPRSIRKTKPWIRSFSYIQKSMR